MRTIASPWWIRLFAVAVLGACALPVAAQLPQPALTTIFPPGGKPGSTFDVTFGGADLDEADQIVFSHPGITGKLKEAPPSDLSKKPKRVEGQFSITIAGDVPPGVYEARLICRFGATNPRAFAVNIAEEIVDAGGNVTPDKAAELKPGTIINGKTDANQYKYYKLALKAGERIVLDCLAERIDSKLDGMLSVLDPTGRELARVRDTEGKDPILEFTAPAEAIYLVRLQDAVYGGGPEYFYRLEAISAPQIDAIFPPAGVAGSNGPFTILGRNLPGGQPVADLTLNGAPLQQVQVNIPLPADAAAQSRLAFDSRAALARATLSGAEYRLPSPQGPSNTAVVYFAKAPVVLEQEPNGDSKQPQKITQPCEVAGRFYPASDLDWYSFDAKKGEVLWLEVISHRLGLPTDPSLAIFRVTKNDKGEETLADVAQVDDPADRNTKMGTDYDFSTDDPSYKFTAPDDGTYRVMVRDQFGTGRKDPRMAYRLVVRPPQPDFALIAQPTGVSPGAKNNQQQQASVTAPVIRKGGTGMIDVDLIRSDEFAGEVTVSVEGLPAGMTCPTAIIGPTGNSAPLVLTAADSMAAWNGQIKVIGKAQINGQEVVREARYAVMVWGSANRQQAPPSFRLTPVLHASVMDKETEPVFVQAEDKIWETCLGANLEVPLTVVRRGDFKEAVKLTAAGLPQEIKPKEINAGGEMGATKLEIPLNVQAIKPGVYTFYLRGESKRKYTRNPDAVTAAEADQKEVVDMIAMFTEQQKTNNAAKDKAVAEATQKTNEAKQAETNKTNAATAVTQKTEAHKQATAKVAQAKEAADKDAANQGLKDALAAAQKATDEAAAQLKAAQDALAVAEKAAVDTQAAAKAADEAKVKAEALAKETTDKLTALTGMKTQADNKLNQVKQANQPKDITFAVVSSPIKMRIAATCLELKTPQPMVAVKQGEKVELPIELNRLFGFADNVEVTFEPQNIAGLTAPKLTLNKDQASGKFEVQTAKNTPAGEHKIPVKAKAKFNNVNVEAALEVTVKVDPAS